MKFMSTVSIFIAYLLTSLSIFAADSSNAHNKGHVEYYKMKTQCGLFGTTFLVPKSCFDKAVKSCYLIDYQKFVFAYEKTMFKADIVALVFSLLPDKDYTPGAPKQEFEVEVLSNNPSAMDFDKLQFANKEAILKYIEENTDQFREKYFHN